MDFKNALIATTAVCTVGGLTIAAAEAASKPKLNVSGYYELFMGASDSDRHGLTSSGTPTYGGVGDGTFNIVHYGEIRFEAEGQTDSGMKWKVRYEDVQNDADISGKKSSTDEAHIELSGSWGKLELGGQDGAHDRVYHGPEKLMHQGPDMIDVFASTSGLADEKMSSHDTSDASKITYWTPKISGFQAGYSYIPQIEAFGSVGTGASDQSGHEGSIQWGGNVGPGKIDASWGFGYLPTSNTSGTSDSELNWRAGITYSQGPWSVAGGYRDFSNDGDNIGNSGDTTAWEVGVAYNGGRWEISALYYDATYEDAGGDVDYSHWGISGAYNLGGGLTISASVWFFDLEDNAAGIVASAESIADGDTDGIVAVLGIGAKF